MNIEMKKNELNSVLDDIETFSDHYKRSTKDAAYYENIVSVLTGEKHKIESEIMAAIDKEEAAPEHRREIIICEDELNRLVVAFSAFKHRIGAIGLKDIGLFQLFEKNNSIFVQFPDRSIVDLSDNDNW